MALTPEALCLRLRKCISEMPNLDVEAMTPALARWLGEAAILVEDCGYAYDTAAFTLAADGITRRTSFASTEIPILLHRALARAERNAPASAQGTFIAAGKPLDAFAAVAKLLSEAKQDVLIVDAYADGDLITKYLVTTPERITCRVLTDEGARKPTLKPAAEAWVRQFGVSRAIEVRAAKKGTLHDRLILLDRKEVWLLGQSFNQLATRSNTYLSQADADLAAMKLVAYEAIWNVATPLI